MIYYCVNVFITYKCAQTCHILQAILPSDLFLAKGPPISEIGLGDHV